MQRCRAFRGEAIDLECQLRRHSIDLTIQYKYLGFPLDSRSRLTIQETHTLKHAIY